MRFGSWLFLLFVLAFAVVAGVALLPYGPRAETFIDIPAGTGTAEIATRLEAAGVVRSRWAFEAMRAARGGALRAGEYRFNHPATVAEIYDRLHRGDVYTIVLLVPEGYTTFDIAAAVEHAGLGSAKQFLEAAHTSAGLVRRWNPTATSVEGFLFPSTYRFNRHSTSATMIAAMVRQFAQTTARLGLPASEALRVVTLASLVEREVHIDGERPVVAGVFENRLRLGMPLQTDPAVAYASQLRGTWTGVIHQSELHSDSSYNTYAHAGLPPGPICNPGLASLRAAMHPAATPYLYFVAQADGSTRFAGSLREHEANVVAYRAGLR